MVLLLKLEGRDIYLLHLLLTIPHSIGFLVAYPLAADNVSRLLPFRLEGVNHPVISTRSVFSTPRSILLTYI